MVFFFCRYKINHQKLENSLLSELLISNVDRSDSGSYFCRANNQFGTDQTSVVLSVQGK